MITNLYKPPKMDYIFIAFANSQENSLAQLENEDDIVYRHLNMGKRKFDYTIFRQSMSSIDKISQALTDYQDEISIFLFSGHAGLKHLLLNDQLARAEGIAHSLSLCPNLKLVMLNGCSTMGHVKLLLDKGIPMVIATSAPVNDNRAYMFSNIFFQMLSRGETIENSFEKAVGNAMIKSDLTIHRSLALVAEEKPETPTWGIFYKEENKDLLNYVLPAKQTEENDGMTLQQTIEATPNFTIPPFDKGIPRYKIDILSLDRRDQADLFEIQFHNQKSNVQHYFIHSDNLQLPNSFGYRLVFQLESWLKKLDKTMHYVAQNNHFVKIKNWKFSSDIGISQRRIKAYFEELFELAAIDSLTELKKEYPLIQKYDYISTIFKIHQEDWNETSAEILNWFIQDFCKTSSAYSTKFLFFFIIEKHVEDESGSTQEIAINSTLEEIGKIENCTIFSELKPVKKLQLLRWFGGFVDKESEINRMVKQIIDNYSNQVADGMNMSHVEEQLSDIIEKETKYKVK